MNEIFKYNTAKKVVGKINRDAKKRGQAMKNIDIAHRLGFNVVHYITMVKNSKQHDKIPTHAWEKFRDFVNSGLELNNYQAKNIQKVEKIEKETTAVPGTEPKTHEIPGGIIPGQAEPIEVRPGEEIKPDHHKPSQMIKEIITPGTPLNAKVEALINADTGLDPATGRIKLIIDIEIRVNGRKVEI